MYSILLLIIQYVDAKDLFSYSCYTLARTARQNKVDKSATTSRKSRMVKFGCTVAFVYVTFKRIQQIALDASKITGSIYNDEKPFNSTIRTWVINL